MGRHEAGARRDLFAPMNDDLPPEMRQRLLPLLETLLREAVGPEGKEANDEQDHA
jgi:hypothetical protein